MAQRTSEKRGWNYGKSQDTMKSSVETVSPTDGCIDKRRIAILMAILTWQGGNSMGSYPLTKKHRPPLTAGRGMSFSQV